MAGFQQIVIVGNLGKDATQHHTKQGKAYWTFSVAVTEKWGAGENRREMTTWYEVALWDDWAESVAEHLKKGKQVMVVGKPGSRAWKAADGRPMTTNTISAKTVQLLGRVGSGRPQEGDWFAQQQEPDDWVVDDSIPF